MIWCHHSDEKAPSEKMKTNINTEHVLKEFKKWSQQKDHDKKKQSEKVKKN